MPKTYEPIQTQTVGTATPSITFSSIPQSYTDLVLVSFYGTSVLDTSGWLRFNSDSGSNYSWTYLLGDGSGAYSGRFSNQTYTTLDGAGAGTTLGTSIQATSHIMNYSNATTNKTVLTRDNNGSTYKSVDLKTGLWRSTAAITSITVGCVTGNLIVGSSFTLYGIRAA